MPASDDAEYTFRATLGYTPLGTEIYAARNGPRLLKFCIAGGGTIPNYLLGTWTSLPAMRDAIGLWEGITKTGFRGVIEYAKPMVEEVAVEELPSPKPQKAHTRARR
jgi:hypothetical protein